MFTEIEHKRRSTKRFTRRTLDTTRLHFCLLQIFVFRDVLSVLLSWSSRDRRQEEGFELSHPTYWITEDKEGACRGIILTTSLFSRDPKKRRTTVDRRQI